jgi:hypothetical protein
MVVAMMYPDGGVGGRGKKAIGADGFAKGLGGLLNPSTIL